MKKIERRSTQNIMDDIMENLDLYNKLYKVREELWHLDMDKSEAYKDMTDELNSIDYTIQSLFAEIRVISTFKKLWGCTYSTESDRDRWTVVINDSEELSILEPYSREFMEWLEEEINQWTTYTVALDKEQWIMFLYN